MNYTMDASYRTRVVRNFLKAYGVKSSQNPDPDFIEKLARISEKEKATSESASAAKDGAAVNSPSAVKLQTEEMTMEEYKEYLSGRISQLPVHPTNMQHYVSIQISEAGLEAMKKDSEYEQWVLSSIKSSFHARDPWSGMCGGKYVVLYFGSEKEQSRGESWRAGFLNGSGNKLFQQKSKNSFWERRAQRRKELAEQYEEMLELKELNKDPNQGLYYGELPILAALQPKSIQSGGPQE